MLTRLNGVLLGGQAERVKAHGVEHVVTGHPAEAGQHIRGDIAKRVPNMQADTAGVREEIEHHELRTLAVEVRVTGVGSPVNVTLGPQAPPLRLEFLGGLLIVGAHNACLSLSRA